jgi:DNA-binding transcriptional MocR family regulator
VGIILNVQNASRDQLIQWEADLTVEYNSIKQRAINLDLTRGKPSDGQLDLADNLDGLLGGNYITESGVDTRNYGGIDGIIESRQLGAQLLGLTVDEVSAQGSSSLTLMFYAMFIAKDFGLRGSASAWKNAVGADAKPTFICPVPGYDRHFTICEQLGIHMVTVPMTSTGPDMDAVEALIKKDSNIVGMWCVPKYSNPTGVIYSDETVKRIAKLGHLANKSFCVFWDNAYAVHDMDGYKPLANIMDYCREFDTIDNVIQFTSTSKITHAGSGVAFIASSVDNLDGIRKVMSSFSIGPDKVNQLRHHRLIPNFESLIEHMSHHAELLKPRFNCVLEHLERSFGDNDLGDWEPVDGGYFISFDAKPHLATIIVRLAAEAGVKLTPAGATFPYGNDPEDRNIRIAPSVPTMEQVDQAMHVFALCVKLASVRQQL